MIKISYEDILSAFLYKYHVLSYLFFIKENRLVNGLYSLRAEYTGKCGKGFVFQPHRAVTVNTVPHLLRELKKDINGPLIEPILKFVDK